MRIDVFAFSGTFLSLVLDLPKAAIAGLKRSHIIGVHSLVETAQSARIFARLNLKHGPNCEQIVREVCPDRPDALTGFDLAYTQLNEKRLEKAWLDLIIEKPRANRIVLHSLTCHRKPRAEV